MRMREPPGRRQCLFFAAFMIVASLGCVHTYRRGAETGVLKLGRSQELIALADSPERFHFWLNGSLVAAALFAALGFVCLWGAFRRRVGS